MRQPPRKVVCLGLRRFPVLLNGLCAVMLHRRGWNYYHHTLGHLVVLLGFANALIGFKVGDLGWGWYLGLVLIWCAILLAAMIKWLRDACVEPKGTVPGHAAAESAKHSTASVTPENGQL